MLGNKFQVSMINFIVIKKKLIPCSLSAKSRVKWVCRFKKKTHKQKSKQNKTAG